MKTTQWIVPGLFAAGLLGAASSAAAVRQDTGLEARVEVLEAQLAEVRAYLQAEAKSAKALSAALDVSEQEGFTFGINPRSREVLLEGFRSHAVVLQQGVPGGMGEAAPENGEK